MVGVGVMMVMMGVVCYIEIARERYREDRVIGDSGWFIC